MPAEMANENSDALKFMGRLASRLSVNVVDSFKKISLESLKPAFGVAVNELPESKLKDVLLDDTDRYCSALLRELKTLVSSKETKTLPLLKKCELEGHPGIGTKLVKESFVEDSADVDYKNKEVVLDVIVKLESGRKQVPSLLWIKLVELEWDAAGGSKIFLEPLRGNSFRQRILSREELTQQLKVLESVFDHLTLVTAIIPHNVDHLWPLLKLSSEIFQAFISVEFSSIASQKLDQEFLKRFSRFLAKFSAHLAILSPNLENNFNSRNFCGEGVDFLVLKLAVEALLKKQKVFRNRTALEGQLLKLEWNGDDVKGLKQCASFLMPEIISLENAEIILDQFLSENQKFASLGKFFCDLLNRVMAEAVIKFFIFKKITTQEIPLFLKLIQAVKKLSEEFRSSGWYTLSQNIRKNGVSLLPPPQILNILEKKLPNVFLVEENLKKCRQNPSEWLLFHVENEDFKRILEEVSTSRGEESPEVNQKFDKGGKDSPAFFLDKAADGSLVAAFSGNLPFDSSVFETAAKSMRRSSSGGISEAEEEVEEGAALLDGLPSQEQKVQFDLESEESEEEETILLKEEGEAKVEFPQDIGEGEKREEQSVVIEGEREVEKEDGMEVKEEGKVKEEMEEEMKVEEVEKVEERKEDEMKVKEEGEVEEGKGYAMEVETDGEKEEEKEDEIEVEGEIEMKEGKEDLMEVEVKVIEELEEMEEMNEDKEEERKVKKGKEDEMDKETKFEVIKAENGKDFEEVLVDEIMEEKLKQCEPKADVKEENHLHRSDLNLGDQNLQAEEKSSRKALEKFEETTEEIEVPKQVKNDEILDKFSPRRTRSGKVLVATPAGKSTGKGTVKGTGKSTGKSAGKRKGGKSEATSLKKVREESEEKPLKNISFAMTPIPFQGEKFDTETPRQENVTPDSVVKVSAKKRQEPANQSASPEVPKISPLRTRSGRVAGVTKTPKASVKGISTSAVKSTRKKAK